MQKGGKGPKGFIVVLPGGIIEIPQDSYLSWLTLFYLMPRVLVEKRRRHWRYLAGRLRRCARRSASTS